ncbi:MAG TPA: outer membrane protein assembly factor BamB [Xanthomonadaceae bacterium]|nr:outer membrane protein assembly factor BamB [Xanthomonadaceae bacterium]
MTFPRIVLVTALIAAVAGCTTVKGWMHKAGGSDNIHEPAALIKITPAISVQRLWSRSTGKGERMLGLRDHPTIADGRVYVVDSYGPNLTALDLTSGRDIWKTNTKLRLTGGPGVGSGSVVAGSVNGDVVAFSADTGAERWRTKLSSEILSTPLVAGNIVIVRCGDGHVVAMDLADGKRRWAFERPLPTLSLRGNPSPILGGNGLVYLGYEDGTLVALRVQDGIKAWDQAVAQPEGRSELDRMADIDGDVVASPDGVYAASYKGKLAAFNPDNGSPLWEHSLVSYGGLARGGDTLYASDAVGTVWAIDHASGGALWKQDALGYRWLSEPAVQDGYVVVGDLQGYLHWMRADSGAIVAREKIGGHNDAIRGTPQVSADGVLVVETIKGKLAAYRINK